MSNDKGVFYIVDGENGVWTGTGFTKNFTKDMPRRMYSHKRSAIKMARKLAKTVDGVTRLGVFSMDAPLTMIFSVDSPAVAA